MNVLVTGATGFIGGRLIEVLRTCEQFIPIAVTRRKNYNYPTQIKSVTIENLGGNNTWENVLNNIGTVIHTAARVHVMKDNVQDPLSEFRRINVDGTLNLAKQAANAGVKRFIFISSIKVNGEFTPIDQPFTENDIPAPVDPYGISKYETEQALYQLADETGMEVVCIRPPLVYGPGVKANFLSMMQWLYKGIPLPFGAIHNKRSLVALDNLVDLIMTCVEHPAAANQTFLAGDGEDLSTTELLREVSLAMNKSPRLIPVPHKMLESGLKLIGKAALAQRLCGSLCVDITKAKTLLNWTPPVSVNEGLKKTVEDFIKGKE